MTRLEEITNKMHNIEQCLQTLNLKCNYNTDALTADEYLEYENMQREWDDLKRKRDDVKAEAANPLTAQEIKAFQVLLLTIPEKKLLGITIRQLDQSHENIKRFLNELLHQFKVAPAATLQAVGFFDLPKFLNMQHGTGN